MTRYYARPLDQANGSTSKPDWFVADRKTGHRNVTGSLVQMLLGASVPDCSTLEPVAAVLLAIKANEELSV